VMMALREPSDRLGNSRHLQHAKQVEVGSVGNKKAPRLLAGLCLKLGRPIRSRASQGWFAPPRSPG
jgi:hypothetical protein